MIRFMFKRKKKMVDEFIAMMNQHQLDMEHIMHQWKHSDEVWLREEKKLKECLQECRKQLNVQTIENKKKEIIINAQLQLINSYKQERKDNHYEKM